MIAENVAAGVDTNPLSPTQPESVTSMVVSNAKVQRYNAAVERRDDFTPSLQAPPAYNDAVQGSSSQPEGSQASTLSAGVIQENSHHPSNGGNTQHASSHQDTAALGPLSYTHSSSFAGSPQSRLDNATSAPHTHHHIPEHHVQSRALVGEEPRPHTMMEMNVKTEGVGRSVDILNSQGRDKDRHGERDWNYGLFSFSSRYGLCCYSFWCPCLVFSKLKTKTRHLNIHGRPDPRGGETCGAWAWIHFCLSCFFFAGPCLQCVNRSEIRTRYHIRGSCCEDFCSACWCTPCELTQELREVEEEEKAWERLNGPQRY